MAKLMNLDWLGKHPSPKKSFRLGFLATLFFLSIAPAPAASIYDPAYTFTNFVGKPPNSGDVPGDTGTATGTAARFFHPLGVAVDQSGNCYVADTYNHRIRKVTPAGVVSTLAGGGPGSRGYQNGTGAAAMFNYPAGVAVTGDGNTVYVSDTGNNVIRRIVTGTGEVTTYAGILPPFYDFGTADGIGTHAQFHHPGGITVNTNGDLFVTDTFNNTVRKITLSSQRGPSNEPLGDVTTFAGLAGPSGSKDGAGSVARFAFNDSAWALTPGGNTPVAGNVEHPSGIAVINGGDIYVADTFNQTIRRITQQGVVTTVCGKVGVTGSADGNAADVRFNCPSGMGVSLSGNIFVADQNNDTIRQVTQFGYTTTLAGKVGVPDWTDGTGDAARFSDPTGIAVFNGNDLFVADRDYCRITHGIGGGAGMTILTQSPLPFATLGSAYFPPLGYPFKVAGGTAPYTWAATGLPAGLTMSADGVLSGTPTVPGIFTFTVSVTDSDDASVEGTFVLTIHALTITGTITSGNVNNFQTDGPPAVTGTAPYLPTPPYVFNISGDTPLPAGLNYTRDGVVSGTPYEAGTFNISLSVQDAAGLTGAATITFTISDSGAPTISTTTLPGGTFGVPYSQTIATTGGYPPIQFTLSSGSLPPGLSLNKTTGVISGTPTTPTPGLYDFTVQATGNDGLNSTKPLSISINGGAIVVNTLTIGGGPSISGTAYIPLRVPLSITGTVGTPPYVFNISGETPLPPGLSFTRDGVISGTPYVTGSFRVDVTAQDAAGLTGATTLTFTIGPSVAPTITTATPLPAGAVGTSYSQPITTTGGYAPIYFTIRANGSLPPGLHLETTTGIISGTPTTPGTFGFTVQATGNDGLYSRKALSINIPSASLTWKALYFTPAELANSAISGDKADPDGDGLSNLAEYAFGGNPVVPDAATFGTGVFSGLVNGYTAGNGTEAENMAAFFASTGFLSLTTKTDGSFTGSLRLEGATLPVKGKFVLGAATTTIKRTGKSDAVVALNFVLAVPSLINGTVSTGGSPLAVQALTGNYTGVNPSIHPLSGNRYTIILPDPDGTLGHGYATLVVGAKGTGTLAGKLADGTAFTTASQIVDDGSDSWVLPVCIPLYTGSAGTLFGKILLPKTEPANSTGSLGWLRPANATMFPSGFLKSLAPLGERYQLTKDISLFSGTAAPAAFTLLLDPTGTLLTTPLAQAATWPKTNIPALLMPVNATLKLTFTGATGVFKGTFSRMVNGKAVSTPYEGAVLSSPLLLPPDTTTPVRAAGFFSTGSASGEVEMD